MAKRSAAMSGEFMQRPNSSGLGMPPSRIHLDVNRHERKSTHLVF